MYILTVAIAVFLSFFVGFLGGWKINKKEIVYEQISTSVPDRYSLLQFHKQYHEWEIGSVNVEKDKLVLVIHKRGGWMPTAAEIAPDGTVIRFGL